MRVLFANKYRKATCTALILLIGTISFLAAQPTAFQKQLGLTATSFLSGLFSLEPPAAVANPAPLASTVTTSAGPAVTSMLVPQTTVDDQGPDDEPGQKDLNSMTIDFGAPGATVIDVFWNWDDTATTGNNTRDGGALFDTDGDGFANFSLYVTVATNGSWVTQLFVCTADSRADRCGGPSLDNTISSTAFVSIVPNSDPFGYAGSPNFTSTHLQNNDCDNNPGCNTDDTVADVNVVLSDFGNPASLALLNVCSYPSGEPNSDPSDCVVETPPGSLTLVKVVNNFGESGAGYLGVSDFPLSIDGNSTTSGTAVSVLEGNHTIAETPQSGYSVGTWSCTDGTTGTSGSASATVNISASENVTCTITNTLIADPSIDLVKSKQTFFSTPPVAGDKITYTFVITNDGNVTLSGVDLDDALVGFNNATCGGVTSLAPGAQTTCTADYFLTQADINAGTVTNNADACGDPPAGAGSEVCDEASTTTPIAQSPALSITKTATEQNYDSVGDVIHYTIVATNTGNVTLNNVAVTDPNVSNLDCNPNVAGNQTSGFTLAPGGSLTCSASHTVTQADIDAGHYANTSCVDDGAGGAAQACDSEDVPADQNPELSIVKAANPTSYDSVGDVINYTITATNTGNVTLAAVTVTDPLVDGLTCTPANGSSLAPGDSMVCTASHTIDQDDLDNGSFANTACVNDGAGGADQVCDDETVTGDQNPALSITKTATEESYDSVGDVIHYTIVATNTGNVTLDNVTVSDPDVSNLSCTPTNGSTLAPGASMTCTATHTVTQGDIDAGHYANTACVDDGAGGAAEDCDDEDVPADQNPALSITKVANPTTYDSVGDVINYTITATNTGNVTLAAVTVTDALVDNLSCTPANGSSLAPGASMVCTASHTIDQDDLDNGSFANTSCVDDGAGGAAQDCDDETVTSEPDPSLSIVKTADPTTYDSVGDVISYEIVATNTGNVTLNNVEVTDANVTDLDCDSVTAGNQTTGFTLAPGDTLTCTASHTITQEDLDNGNFGNTACVDDGDEGAAEACDDETVTSDPNPALSITKTANPTTYDSVGDVITYTIVATNTGNVTLHNVTVTDAKVSNLSCTPDVPVTDLAPGASINCTASHTITLADLDAGFYANTSCVDDGEEGAAEACDDETVTGDKNPALTVEKTSTTTLVTVVGQVVPYTYVVTNTGNVTLTNVTLSDDKIATLDCDPAEPATLAPGATMECTGSHTVTQAEFDDASGTLVNIATADSDQTSEVTDSVTIPIEPPPPTGHIFHTGVTCSDFVSGLPGLELESAQYGTKSGKVNNVAPGVMFYYISITAPSSAFTINVTQENDAGWKVMPDQGVNQIILYEADCRRSSKGTSSFVNGTSRISVTGSVTGLTYIVGIKYSLSGLAGEAVSPPLETATYSFATNFNGGSPISGSQDSISIFPNQ